MSLLQYFSCVSKPDGVSLPSPLGSLSLSVFPIAAIASANAEVRHVMEAAGTNRRKWPYSTYTPEQRVIIGKHALENGVIVRLIHVVASNTASNSFFVGHHQYRRDLNFAPDL